MKLSADDVARAEAACDRRMIRPGTDTMYGHGDPGRTRADRAENNLAGIMGEIAYCRLVGVPYDVIELDGDRPGHGDLNGVEIRTTVHEHGSLIVYPNDNPDLTFALVVVRLAEYLADLPSVNAYVVGEVGGDEAIAKGRTPGDHQVTETSAPQLWVPQHQLRPPSRLRWRGACADHVCSDCGATVWCGDDRVRPLTPDQRCDCGRIVWTGANEIEVLDPERYR